MNDPSTGPIPREKFAELVNLTAGKAREEIQKYDPFWGLQSGGKIEFEVVVTGRMEGRAYIKASSQKEADALADDLSDSDIDWDYGDGDFDILSVEPHKPGR